MTSLRERLSRAPDSYSWSSFRISGRACVGVWAPKIGVIRRERAAERRDVRAFVLDYGCTSDRVGELVLCGAPPGEQVRERGLYVDQLYF